MPRRRTSSLDKVLGRIESLDSSSLTVLAQRLARERSLLEAVFNLLREGVLIIDPEGFILYANESGARMTGLREKDIGELTLWKLVPGLHDSLEFELEDLQTQIPSVSREVSISYPEDITVRLYIVPFQEEEDQTTESTLPPEEEEKQWKRFAVILSDVTKEKESTAKALESERIQSLFHLAAGVAHELGNPLNSLTIHLQLTERKIRKALPPAEAEKILDSLNICRGEVKRLDGIIQNFLGAIRLDSPDFQKLHLLDLVEDVLKVLGEELRDRDIEVEVEWKRQLPDISADRNQIKQVLFNLLKNAMEAMPRGGFLRISFRRHDDGISMLIADTGDGIARDDLGKVFQPYFTTKKQGNGLGLMIVHRIMRAHQGHIGIESREGTGTVISLFFPTHSRSPRLLPESPNPKK
ncbi:MAG: PAS domain-containing protein [Opitutales bacterium]|nr:PAS domain-containing protein [Opitutales bacterium]MCH8540792.1 PAS domain-containing protein [Opitutales bacterium]